MKNKVSANEVNTMNPIIADTADLSCRVDTTSNSSYDCPKDFAKELIEEFLCASLDETMTIITDRGWNFQLHSTKLGFTAKVFGEHKESYLALSSCPKDTLQRCAINLQLNLEGHLVVKQ